MENDLQLSPENIAEIATYLIEMGSDPDASCETYGGGVNQTPLQYAAWFNQRKAVQILNENGADKGKKDSNTKRTASQWAAQ